MRGRAFSIAAGVSLLLFAAALALWGRSYIVWDTVRYDGLGDGWELAVPAENAVDSTSGGSASFVPVRSGATATAASLGSRRGVCAFRWVTASARVGGGVRLAEADKGVRYYRVLPSPADAANSTSSRGFAGFYFVSNTVTDKAGAWRQFAVSLPHWFLVLWTAVLPIVWVRRYRRARGRREGCLCASCGYDLRATPGRCPECGAAGSGCR